MVPANLEGLLLEVLGLVLDPCVNVTPQNGGGETVVHLSSSVESLVHQGEGPLLRRDRDGPYVGPSLGERVKVNTALTQQAPSPYSSTKNYPGLEGKPSYSCKTSIYHHLQELR